MDTSVTDPSIAQALAPFVNEEELIIKPLQPGSTNEAGAIECGRIVSRTNKVLFDYQIGDKSNPSMFESIFSQKIVLFNPGTKKIVLEFNENRLPFFCQICHRQDVRCCSNGNNTEMFAIGSIQRGLAFTKVWYDIYDRQRQRKISLVLRKNHLRGKLQHRVPEFTIVDNDETSQIGRVYLYSTDFQRTEYGQAVAVKVPNTMNIETKAVLLFAALIGKTYLN